MNELIPSFPIDIRERVHANIQRVKNELENKRQDNMNMVLNKHHNKAVDRAAEVLTTEAIQRVRARWDKEYPVHKSVPTEGDRLMRALNITCALPPQAFWRLPGA